MIINKGKIGALVTFLKKIIKSTALTIFIGLCDYVQSVLFFWSANPKCLI